MHDDYLSVYPDWASVCIVLAGGIDAHGHIHADTMARCDAGLQLLDEEVVERLVLTGGMRAAGKSEARAMADYLVARGAPRSRLVLEERSRDTIGNAVYTKRLLVRASARRFILVTSDYHLARALMIFRHVFSGKDVFKGVAAPSVDPAVHRLHELDMRQLEDFMLSTLPQGDDKRIERFMLTHVPQYAKDL